MKHFHQWLFLSETRHQCPWSPADVGSVAAVGGMRIAYHWWWAESCAGRHGGRRLASVRAEIHFNITIQREVPEIFV